MKIILICISLLLISTLQQATLTINCSTTGCKNCSYACMNYAGDKFYQQICLDPFTTGLSGISICPISLQQNYSLIVSKCSGGFTPSCYQNKGCCINVSTTLNNSYCINPGFSSLSCSGSFSLPNSTLKSTCGNCQAGQCTTSPGNNYCQTTSINGNSTLSCANYSNCNVQSFTFNSVSSVFNCPCSFVGSSFNSLCSYAPYTPFGYLPQFLCSWAYQQVAKIIIIPILVLISFMI